MTRFYILFMLWSGGGQATAPSIFTQEFRTALSCEAARDQFLVQDMGYLTGRRRAFCIYDPPGGK